MNKETLNILLIEDNPDDQDLIREYLCGSELDGTTITISENLDSGLSLLAQNQIDIVLLDLSLPDSFGLDGFKRIFANHPEVPVVILTGLSDSESALEAIRIGAQDYLVKGNYEPSLLVKTINYSIERNKLVSSLYQANLELEEARITALELAQNCNLARDEVVVAQQELRRQKEGLEHFAYVSTHDLRAPVVNLQSLLKFLDRTQLGNVQNTVVIDKIDGTVERMSETLHDLIEVVAVTKEALDRQPELLDFEGVLTKVCQNIEQLIQSSEAVIHRDFSEAKDITYVPGHIKSVFQNLITNAIKYKSDKRTPRIEIKSKRVNGFVTIYIQDNGRGIDMEKHGGKLFSMFKQLQKGIPGKGLGLYIVKSQIEALGGKIEVESEIDKGTLFIVQIKDQLNGK